MSHPSSPFSPSFPTGSPPIFYFLCLPCLSLIAFFPTRPLTIYDDVHRHKFWNVKMSSNRRLSSHAAADSASESSKHGAQDEEEPWTEEERQDTAHSIKTKQNKMEEQVSKIWTCVYSLIFPNLKTINMSDIVVSLCVGSYLRLKSQAQRASRICYGMSAIANTSRRFGTRKGLSCTSRCSLRPLMTWNISSRR